MLWIALPLIALATLGAGLVIRHHLRTEEAREQFDAAWNGMSEQERAAFVERIGDQLAASAKDEAGPGHRSRPE